MDLGKIGRKFIGIGWKDQPVPKGLPACVSVAASLVPVGVSNRYQWKPKAPVEKPGVLRRGHWSRLRDTGWETGAFSPSQPVPKVRFLVVLGSVLVRVFLENPNGAAGALPLLIRS